MQLRPLDCFRAPARGHELRGSHRAADRKLPTFDCAREEGEDIENGSRSNRSAHEQFEDPISPPFHGGGDQVVAISEMDVKSATRTSRAGADGVETRNIEPFLGEGLQRGIDEGFSCPTLC